MTDFLECSINELLGSGFCTPACLFADLPLDHSTDGLCTCTCGGTYHGVGRASELSLDHTKLMVHCLDYIMRHFTAEDLLGVFDDKYPDPVERHFRKAEFVDKTCRFAETVGWAFGGHEAVADWGEGYYKNAMAEWEVVST
jgi:hypothetical protein